MNASIVDLVALLRAIFISIGCGLLMMSISFFITKSKPEREKWKMVFLFGIFGIMILIGVCIYSIWPSLITTPNIEKLSQAEAEQLLLKDRLIPNPKPQYSLNTEYGRVIQNSQNPQPGLKVNTNTIVSFSVSIKPSLPPPTPDSIPESFSFLKPIDNGKAFCRCSSDGICTISVSGISTILPKSKNGLLIWIKPIKPSSESNEWYLQRPPQSGKANMQSDGSWTGTGQIGNRQYPPKEGDIINIAITCANLKVIDSLMNARDVVVCAEPIGMGKIIHENVILTFKN